MKKIVLSILTVLSLSVAFGQVASDSITIRYNLSPTKKFQEDVFPQFTAYIKLNGKKYSLNTIVMINTKAGDVAPDITYNKKAKRNEYGLKTWFAGGGTNFKAYVSGSKASNTAYLMVYKQEVDEQAPDSKWKLVKAIKL